MHLSVIILSYNTPKLIKACLDSLIPNLPEKSEIIVVDNSSTDNSVEVIKKFKQVKLIKNTKNLGFAAANNQAAKIAAGEILLFLNSDTIVQTPLTPVFKFFVSHDRCAVISPQLLGLNGQVQSNGGSYPNLLNLTALMFFIDDLPLIGRTINKYHQSPGFFNQTRKLDWVSGAALFIRKSVFKQVGGWNETIFMYGEDVDLCSQAKAKGWQIWTLSTTKITHIGQGSGHHGQALTGEISWLVDYFSANKPRYQLPLIKAILKAGALLRAYLFGKIMHKKEYYELYRKAATLAG